MSTERRIRLAIDGCGGDFGPDMIVPAALQALRARPDLDIRIVVTTELQSRVVTALGEHDRVTVRTAATALDSGVGPIAALRQGDRSTLGKAMSLLAEGQADACLSAGSTTALMALGVRLVGLLPGILRPALGATVPSAGGQTLLLDLGANLEVEAQHLVQFALMGLGVVGESEGAPRIGLLNVGHEEGKGHSVVKEAHGLLQALPLNYVGFIEGNDIFAGKVDIAVCDGFAGNLVLKSSEGLARMLFGALKDTLFSSRRARLGAALAGPALRQLVARFDPAKHNGAPLLGLDGVVVKSHGSSRMPATVNAILEACEEVGKQVPERIGSLITRHQAGTIT